MNKDILIAVLIGIALVFSGCSGKKDTTSTNSLLSAKPKSVQKLKPVTTQAQEPKMEYTVQGVRDPFQPYEIIKLDDLSKMTAADILQNITLGQISLVGVILDKDPKALVQDASNTGYIIKEGMHIGENSGIVTKISSNGVTIKQHFKDYMGKVNTREVVLTLKKEEGEK
jgi:type IV pilus assembly protein PilP